MKNNNIVAFIIITGLVIFGILYSSANSKVSVSDSSNKSEKYLKFKGDFLKGCLENGTYAKCDCSFNYLNNELGLYQFEQEAIKYTETGVIPQVIYDAALYCKAN